MEWWLLRDAIDEASSLLELRLVDVVAVSLCLFILFQLEDVDGECLFVITHGAKDDRSRFVESRVLSR